MTQIKVWKCDICKTEYKDDGDIQDFYDHRSLLIDLNITNMFTPNDGLFEFKDVCVYCRRGLAKVIDTYIFSQDGEG